MAKQKVKLYKEFEKEVPKTVRYEINEAINLTRKTGREHSLTFCTIKNKDNGKVFTGDSVKGTRSSTDVKDCSKTGGQKIGDLHTHPVDDITVGIMPSEGDFTATLSETKDLKKKQLACITNHESKYIHCFTPKSIPDSTKINKYRRALFNTGSLNDVDPFFRNSIHKDFNHIYYDKRTFQRSNPSPDDIITDAFGRSKRLKARDLKEIEKGTFCDLVQDYTSPGNNSVGIECRERLKTRNFIPFSFQQINELKKIHKYFFA